MLAKILGLSLFTFFVKFQFLLLYLQLRSHKLRLWHTKLQWTVNMSPLSNFEVISPQKWKTLPVSSICLEQTLYLGYYRIKNKIFDRSHIHSLFYNIYFQLSTQKLRLCYTKFQWIVNMSPISNFEVMSLLKWHILMVSSIRLKQAFYYRT